MPSECPKRFRALPFSPRAHKRFGKITSVSKSVLAVVIALLLLLSVGKVVRAQDSHLSVYAPQIQFQVPVIQQQGVESVGLVELLEPLGKVESRVKGKKWLLTFRSNGKDIQAEFQNGNKKGKVRGNEFDLGANFSLDGERGYVPVSSLPNLLPRIIEKTVDLHAQGRRLFIGSVAFKPSFEVRHSPNRLVISFSEPVAPAINSEGNKIRLTFRREPVIGNGNEIAPNPANAPIGSTSFSESNGAANLEVNGTAPLQATTSESGKAITISAAPQSAHAATNPAPAKPPIETPLPPPDFPVAITPAPARPSQKAWLVILDPGHGGDERGAQLTQSLNEKDVTLALAKRIQHELESRGISVMLLRGGDSTMTFDQRAAVANSSHAALYVSIHAATLGTGTRVYTALLPPGVQANRRAFLKWDTAQASFIQQSSAVKDSIANEFHTRKLALRALEAPVRPINNVACPAIALELAPANDTVETLNDPKYQQDVAAAVAAGIAGVRGKVEASQ